MERPLFRTYLFLLALAVLGAALTTLAGSYPAALFAVLALAFFKGRLVVLDFMAMRQSGRAMRVALLLWCSLFLALAFGRFIMAG